MANKETRITFRPGNVENKMRENAAKMGIDVSEYLRQLIAKDSGICPTCGQPIKK